MSFLKDLMTWKSRTRGGAAGDEPLPDASAPEIPPSALPPEAAGAAAPAEVPPGPEAQAGAGEDDWLREWLSEDPAEEPAAEAAGAGEEDAAENAAEDTGEDDPDEDDDDLSRLIPISARPQAAAPPPPPAEPEPKPEDLWPTEAETAALLARLTQEAPAAAPPAAAAARPAPKPAQKPPKIWEVKPAPPAFPPPGFTPPVLAPPTLPPPTILEPASPKSDLDFAAERARTRALGFDSAGRRTTALLRRAGAEPPPPARYPTGWLVVTEGPGRGAFFPLVGGVNQIGRDPDQAVRLDFGDPAISAQGHASVAFDDETGRFYLGHGGKTSLVRLNNRPVLSTEEINSGDVIRIGVTVMRFVALCGPDFSWQTGEAGGAAAGA